MYCSSGYTYYLGIIDYFLLTRSSIAFRTYPSYLLPSLPRPLNRTAAVEKTPLKNPTVGR